MGRRLFFLIGAALLIACGPARVLGLQQAAPAPAPIEQPGALLPPADAIPAPEEPADFPPVDDEPAPAPSKALGGLAIPGFKPSRPAEAAPRDDEVERVQAPAPAPGPASAPPSGDGGFLLQPDRLALGKHEVLVSVEVQAPPVMNVNKEATVKLVVANAGSADAYGVVVRDELPPGLTFVSSAPMPENAEQGGPLVWKLGTLPASTSRVIQMKVTPTQVTPMDQGATVSFLAGSKARTRVLQPKIKVEVVQTPSIPKVLKGQKAEFRISVTNTGDGPARNVVVLAKLSPGLAHESGERNEQNSFDIPLDSLGPFERRDLPPFVVDTKQGGRQTCTVKATSPDVIFDPADGEVERFVEVVEPQLKMQLAAPEKRYTDTIAPYELTIENPGTAPARKVQVVVSLGVGGRLVKVPPDATWDGKTHRLSWSIPEIAPGEKARSLAFDVRMGDVGFYEVTAEARAENVADVREKRSTDVQGMADLDLIVREVKRVVDVGSETMFLITLQNYGTKDATNVVVHAKVSPNLQIFETSGGPEGESKGNKNGTEVAFPKIERIGANKKVTLGIKVKAVTADDPIGVCTVDAKHDDLPKELQGMANVKVTEGRRTAGAAEPTAK
ncbi:DUF11 domain-containing protein [Paludisphaera soli]|uniref:DUF11 domain-containing protein n=1 Tax=Paludisphaera soli TaxID=2712865 RepID=UPI0013ED37CE|nr:DUF11 domain-containing protein [Paludisphaera soli]